MRVATCLGGLLTGLTLFCSMAEATFYCRQGATIDFKCYNYCAGGLNSDPDFDGWGWENNRSCVVRNSRIDPMQTCIARPPGAPEVDLGFAFQTYSKVPLRCQFTNDQSNDLKLLTELPLLEGSCERHYRRLDPQSGKLLNRFKGDAFAEADLIRCGKSIFIYGGYDVKDLSIGLPETLADVLLEGLKNRYGDRLSQLGFFPDPWDNKFPLGLAPSPRHQVPGENGRNIVMTCATCHIGRTAQGKYVVGLPNEKMDVGMFNTMIYYSIYRTDQKKADHLRWPEKVQKLYKEYDQIIGLSPEATCGPLENKPSDYRTCMKEALASDHRPQMIKLLDQINGSVDADEFFAAQGLYRPSVNELESFASGTPGSYNPIYPSYSVRDRQVLWTPGPIWRLGFYPSHDGARDAGSIFQFNSVEDFVKSATYATFSDPRALSDVFSDPVASYVRTLTEPRNPNPPPADQVELGRVLFQQYCVSCHNGVDGETTRRVEIAQIGAPETFRSIFLNYKASNPAAQKRFDFINAIYDMDNEQNEIHSRKLRGIWSRNLLMLNGAVKGLEGAFCLDVDRPTIPDRHQAYSDASHLDLCHDYRDEHKRALIAFLRSW